MHYKNSFNALLAHYNTPYNALYNLIIIQCIINLKCIVYFLLLSLFFSLIFIRFWVMSWNVLTVQWNQISTIQFFSEIGGIPQKICPIVFVIWNLNVPPWFLLNVIGKIGCLVNTKHVTLKSFDTTPPDHVNRLKAPVLNTFWEV